MQWSLGCRNTEVLSHSGCRTHKRTSGSEETEMNQKDSLRPPDPTGPAGAFCYAVPPRPGSRRDPNRAPSRPRRLDPMRVHSPQLQPITPEAEDPAYHLVGRAFRSIGWPAAPTGFEPVFHLEREAKVPLRDADQGFQFRHRPIRGFSTRLHAKLVGKMLAKLGGQTQLGGFLLSPAKWQWVWCHRSGPRCGRRRYAAGRVAAEPRHFCSSGAQSNLPQRHQPAGGTAPAVGRSAGAAWLLALAIPFAFLLFASVGPVLDQAVGSFFNWYDVHPVSFAGFRYYSEMLGDFAAREAIEHTAIYVAITVPIEVVLGLGGAWLVYRARRGRSALTTLFVLPLVIPWSSAAQLFSSTLSATSGFDGAINHLIGNSTPPIWSLEPPLGFGVLVFIGIWKGAPWCFLLMLAALSTAPTDLFEAGRMDGGRGLSYWRYVVIPTVLPMLVFVTVFRLFTEAQMAQSVDLLTQGAPSMPPSS